MPRLQDDRRNQQSGAFRRLFLLLILMGSTGILLNAQSSYHHLILASYETFEDASRALPAFQQSTNQQPVILFPEAGSKYYRVSAYQSTNRAEVEGFSKSLQQQGKPKGWILTLTPSSLSTTRGSQPQPATSSNQRVASTNSSQSPSLMRYHLVVQSHPSFEKAQQGVSNLAAKGLEPYVIFPSGEIKAYRVSVFTSTNKAEIDAYASGIRRSGFSDAWILDEPLTSTTRSASSGGTMTSANARTASTSGVTYYLIGGSYPRYDAASDAVNSAKASGLPAEILWPLTGEQANFRLSLFSSTRKAEVEAFQRELVSKGREKGWILAR